MKRNRLLIVCIGALLVSCGSSNQLVEEISNELNLPGRIASGRADSYAYNLNRSDSTLSRIDYQYYTPQLPTGLVDSTYKEAVNARIVEWASTEFVGPETVLNGPLTDYYFERVVNDFTIDEQDDKDGMGAYQWSMNIGFNIHEEKNFVCLETNAWWYTGGAHGNGATTYEYFRRETGEEIGLDYFVVRMEDLLAIAEKHFREQQELEEDITWDEAGFWFDGDEFHLTENFYFENGTMVFVFNPYDISAYAAGTIELTVPLNELKGIVDPETF